MDRPMELFRVSFGTYAKKPARYRVCTSHGAYKAVVIATEQHTHAHPRTPIFDVEVEPLGAAAPYTPGAKCGPLGEPLGFLIDPLEWR